jgi:translation elongation factor EF-Tu-like GTPase
MREPGLPILMLSLATIAACADSSDRDARTPAVPSTAAAAEEAGAGEFLMIAADAFRIATGGVIVTGQITAGAVTKGDTVCLSGGRFAEVMGIEIFRRAVDSATAGDRVGLLFSNIAAEDVSAGDELKSGCAGASGASVASDE